MTISINSMTSVLAAQQALERTGSALNKNFQRLASGMRIVSAGDDPAALSVAMRMTSQLGGANAAKNNANDTLSLLQVADAALAETTNALQKVRDLAVDAKTDTKSASDRLALRAEVQGLVSEINRIATSTEMFNKKLLDGTFTANVQIDPNLGVGRTLEIDIAGISLLQLGLGVNGSQLNVSTIGSASTAINAADEAMTSVSMIRASLGAMQSRLSSIVSGLNSASLGYAATRSRAMDTDVAAESSDMTRNKIQQQASIAILAQANLQSQSLLTLLGLNK
ncbi:MAG: flagellin FliC [Magnetococcus sp. YQC-3]